MVVFQKIAIFAILIAIYYFEITYCEKNHDYYKNLIETNIEKSNSYTPQERNIEFELGAKESTIIDYGTFDFIVVGSGSAGSVVAARLSELSHYTTLLIEAGGNETDFSDIPNMAGYLWNSDMDWGYKTIPQNYVCAEKTKSNICSVPRGKVIGGTSTINGAHYTRGNRRDLDAWAKLGNYKWRYSEVLKYFKKSERTAIGDSYYRGRRGELNVEYSYPDLDTLSNFIEAHKELGRKVVDYNGRQQIGVGKIQFNTRNGRRLSSGRAFLEKPRKTRPNLKVLTKSLATKLIIKQKRVVGVIFIHDNKKFKASARKEVILSAGAYNTPQLLMLSGIGPRAHLNQLGIDVIEDLPVGQDFFEHSAINIAFTMNHTIKDISLDDKINLFLTNNSGPLTKTTTVDAISFEHLPGVPKDVPMFEILFNSKNNITNFDILLQHPKSRGWVKLKSSDPLDHPLINPNMIADAVDRKNIIKAIKWVFNLAKTKAFAPLNLTFHKETDKCDHLKELTDDFWECYMRNLVDIPCHACGTTKVGPSRGKYVVDQDLKVFGFENLRVVDAGVIPTTMSGHLSSVAIMIAEKASDIIKKVHK